ncbi:MAG: hypothetical protein ACYTEQ_25580 [Planctomycetota bacterium]|jgi:hypothetical protein
MSQKSKSHITREDETRREKAVDVAVKDVAVDSTTIDNSSTTTDCQPDTETCLKQPNQPKKAGRPPKVKASIKAQEVQALADKLGMNKITDNQVSFLVEYLNSEPGTVSNAALCRRIGITEQSACKWWKNPMWVELLWRMAIQREQAHLATIWAVVRDRAKSGNMAAVGMYVQRFDPEFIMHKAKTGRKSEAEKAKIKAAQAAIAGLAKDNKSIPLAPTGTNTK